jgi:hypothetical protein
MQCSSASENELNQQERRFFVAIDEIRKMMRIEVNWVKNPLLFPSIFVDSCKILQRECTHLHLAE